MQISPLEKIEFKNGESISAYKKLVEIFNNKPKKELKVVKEKKVDEKSLETKKLSSDIITAFKRELSKTESISNTPLDKLDTLINSFTKLVINEIKTKYKESNLDVPYSEDLLEKQSLLIVSSLVNKEIKK